MYKAYERTPQMREQYSDLMRRLEELKGEADFRCQGGFQTEDQRFAWTMSELIREMIAFMDSTDDILDDMEDGYYNVVSEMQTEIDNLNDEVENLSYEIKSLKDRLAQHDGLRKVLREILLDKGIE